jgi:hypothetical protein
MPELTKEFCCAVSPRSLGSVRLAPEIKLWSSPDSSPPIDAKATNIHVKCFGFLNSVSKNPFL